MVPPPSLPAPPESLLQALRHAVGSAAQVRHRSSDRLAMGHDASHFALVPSAVVSPTGAREVGRLFAAAAAHGVPLTFRSGGTSLSGQGVTDGVLVDTRRHFRSIDVLDDGLRVRVGPGSTIRQVNTRLAPFGRKLGPDPASETACTLGGVVANNSSGMACGTSANSYRTLDSLTLVLPSGTVLDTGGQDADTALRHREPALYAGLTGLRDRIRTNPESMRTIARQFAMKNTMGYGLNSFLDHDRPIDILAHLIVGSEGTLAFVAEVVMRTVPLLPHARTGLLVFENLSAATAALPELVSSRPATIELLDAASLRVGQADPQADDVLRSIEVREHAALLLEYQGATAEEVDELCRLAAPLLAGLPLPDPTTLTADAQARARLWHVRKGLYATIAGARPSGTTALLEDVVVPVPELLPTCEALTALFVEHEYRDSVIFGHAKDGNIHFMLTERLGTDVPLDRFVAFTDDLVDLILAHGGSLKAEHGTGRMMAPYVRRQYGDELYDVMWEIKRLCDPQGVLNPGVVLSHHSDAHVQHLKTAPTVEPEVDRCVECGYCEPVCPSKDLTLTPRQRIVLRREIEHALEIGDRALVAELEADYRYDGLETCAVDGMCQTACPVSINTGDLVRRLRAEGNGPMAGRAWRSAARHWDAGLRAAKTALNLAAALPAPLVSGPNKIARAVVSKDRLPLWSPDLPEGGTIRAEQPPARTPVEHFDLIYFTACVGTMFGPSAAGPGVRDAFLELCDRAGLVVGHPPYLREMCCGTPWKSKGLDDGYRVMAAKVLPVLWAASGRGRLPIVCDASSCTEGLAHLVETSVGSGSPYQALRIVDAVEFADEQLLARLPVVERIGGLAVHPTCSSTRMGSNSSLLRVARAVATTVTVPIDWGCCAFAGDRGLLHPELTASATTAEAAELSGRHFDGYASSNRTCELGLTRATGQPYQHVLELLAQVTRPGGPA